MEGLKIDFEQSRETEADQDKYGPSGILSYNGPQSLEFSFLSLSRTMCIVGSPTPDSECQSCLLEWLFTEVAEVSFNLWDKAMQSKMC